MGAKPKVGFIIPFRNREAHLAQFTKRITEHSRGKYDPWLFIMEQAEGEPFNRGALLNLGVLQVNRILGDNTPIALHDVDMLPAPSVNYHQLEADFVHLATCVSQFKNKMPYQDYFGGVVATTPRSMISVGGFPMDFWGWGGEDDALLLRVKASGLSMRRRYNQYFISLAHEREIDGDLLWKNRELLEKMRRDPYTGGRISSEGWTVDQTPSIRDGQISILRFLCTPS